MEAITSVKWADDRTIVTTSRDTVVCIWRIVQNRSYELKLMKCLRGHRETVNTVAISVAYSIIVSGSEDKSCIVWDLNRLEYVRQLGKHEDGVRVVAINDATGDIATCSGPVLRLWTVNGDLILQKYTTQIGDPILDCVFYAGRTGEWVSREILFTSHRRGTIKVWEKAVVDGQYKNTHLGSMSISSLQNSLDSMVLTSESPSSGNGSTVLASSHQPRNSTSTQASVMTGAAAVVGDDGLNSVSPSGHGRERTMSSNHHGFKDENGSLGVIQEIAEDQSSFGERTRQSSHTTSSTSTVAGNQTKNRVAKWALRLRQAYTYEDRLRVDGGVVPNIVSLYVSR